jgi:hypothetical protein
MFRLEYDSATAPRDGLGRIARKAETHLGTTREIEYAYDVLERLTDVSIDGVLTEHYEYDLNDNRLVGQTPAASVVGVTVRANAAMRKALTPLQSTGACRSAT